MGAFRATLALANLGAVIILVIYSLAVLERPPSSSMYGCSGWHCNVRLSLLAALALAALAGANTAYFIRANLVGDKPGQLRRLLQLWMAAKEAELHRRANTAEKPDAPRPD